MQHTQEFELIALVIDYPELLGNTILKPEYFSDKNKILYEILTKEYERSKTLIINNLIKYEGFDIEYFSNFIGENVYYSSRKKVYEELQRNIIDNYKQRKYKEIINSFNGDIESNLKKLEKVNDLSYEETNYITKEDVITTLTEENEQILVGYPVLDANLKLMKTDFLIVGSGTGTGKTAFALNLLYNLSKKYQCVYFNMEMSKKILYKRMVSMATGITMKEIENYKELREDKKTLIKDQLQHIENSKIIMLNGSYDIQSIKRNIMNIKTDLPIVAILDHIGLIKSKGNSLYERMTEIAKQIRQLCLECNVTIIGVCQLSRESQKSNEVPTIQDLRDSGEIEQSARKIILLHDKDRDKQDRTHKVDIMIAKSDDSAKTIKEFEFDRYTQKFSEVWR